MTDIWFLFGVTAVKPDFLDVIGANAPRFQRIGLVTQEVVPQGEADPKVCWISNPAAGYLDPSVDRFRLALRDKVAKCVAGAPIISLYAAAKLCQFWDTEEATLRRTMKDFHDIYQLAATATGVNRPSARLMTMLGACIVDETLSSMIQQQGYEAMAPGADVVNEFGFAPETAAKDPEWQTVKTFVQNPRMTAIDSPQKALLSSSTWTCGCRERLFFYASFKRAAN